MKDLTKYSDKELIDEYKKTEDEKHFSVIVNRYMHLIFGSCMKYLKSEEEASDASIEICTDLASKLLKHDVEHFKSWLYILTKNHCLQILRKKRSHDKKFEDYAIEQKQSMEFSFFDHHNTDDVEKEKLLAFLNECMEQLNDFQKECIRLFYLNSKCYREIEELTNHSIKKVKSYIQNGKRNLSNCIKQKI